MMRKEFSPPIDPQQVISRNGREKIVYQHAYDQKLVVGVYKENYQDTPATAKARYYLAKIANLLLPDIFPNLHLVSATPHITIVDKVIVDQELEKIKYYYVKFPNELAHTQQQIEEIGLDYDGNPSNFCYDQNGCLRYLDILTPWSESEWPEIWLYKFYDEDKIHQFLSNLTRHEQVLGSSWLNRLETLRQQELSILNQREKFQTTDQTTIIKWANQRQLLPIQNQKNGRIDLAVAKSINKVEKRTANTFITWSEWFTAFELNQLSLVYQEHSITGEKSFNYSLEKSIA